MLKSKLLKNTYKEKDTSFSSNVNSKDSNVHNKSSLKKLLNGKNAGHNLLNLNNIKPIKPKGSLYDLNYGLKEENYDKSEDENENDNMTLTSSSPKTLEPNDVAKDKITSRILENQDLNTINDTQSSPNLHWASSVASNTFSNGGKGIASTTYDSMKTLTSSNYNSPKSNPISSTNLNNNTINNNNNNQKTSSKSSSPFLSPTKSPLEAITRLSPFKSSENNTSPVSSPNNFLSVPNLNNKSSTCSLQSNATTHSTDSVNKVSKKYSKKEKKEGGNSSGSGSSKRPTSLLFSIGKYFKYKTSEKSKEKERKNSKEKSEVNESEVTKEQIGNLMENEEWKKNLMNHYIKINNNNSNNTEEEITDIIKINYNDPITSKPKEEEVVDIGKLSSQITHSMQSMTLVESQPTNSEPSSISSATTQPIPIESSSLKVIDKNIKVTASPTSLTSDVKNSVCSSEGPLFLNSSTEEITAIVKEKDHAVTIDKEGTYRQSYVRSDDASYLDNEDTIIKKSSIVSNNNNRLSVRDINICRELKMTSSDFDGSGNSLTIESTITDLKHHSTATISEDNKSALKTLAENSEVKSSIDYSKSPLSNTISNITTQNSDEEGNIILFLKFYKYLFMNNIIY